MKSYLFGSIVAERYGDGLTDEEVAHFDALRSDYEVEWHLGRIRDGRRAPGADFGGGEGAVGEGEEPTAGVPQPVT